MSTNQDIAAIFERIALMLELLGEDKFRVNAHAKAARTLEDLTTDIAALADDKKSLMALEGIGAKTAEKIVEYVTTGTIAEHDELAQRVPAGLLEVLEVPGLGPKTVKLLWDELGVTDVAGLRRVIDDGTILNLPRMGAKTVENIKASLAFAESSGERLPLGVAMPIAERIVEHMRSVKGVEHAAFAGSLRRGRDTIGDIDILVSTADPERAHKAFTSQEGVERVLASGTSKSSVRLAIDSKRRVQADLRVVPEESWGAALMYFTGSKEHNVRLRELALKKGLTLNEYGLFPETDDPTPPQQRGVKPVAGRTEAEVYTKLGLAYIPPELREDRGELGGDVPELIEVGDIKAELHAHTDQSDGSLTLDELITLAKARGFHTLAVTDHSKSSVQANGLSEDRLRAHIASIREANNRHAGIMVLAGSEVDIHADGSLDYGDELLAELDVVVCSPHTALSQDAKAATKRLIRAIEHPACRILGHPTGRLINRRPGLSPAMDEVIAAAIAHDVALEINAHWLRLDLRDTHVRAAVEAGALIAIDCDVHRAEDYDNLRYGVLTGRRGWLTKDRCVNCWGAKKLREWLCNRSGPTIS